MISSSLNMPVMRCVEIITFTRLPAVYSPAIQERVVSPDVFYSLVQSTSDPRFKSEPLSGQSSNAVTRSSISFFCVASNTWYGFPWCERNLSKSQIFLQQRNIFSSIQSFVSSKQFAWNLPRYSIRPLLPTFLCFQCVTWVTLASSRSFEKFTLIRMKFLLRFIVILFQASASHRFMVLWST